MPRFKTGASASPLLPAHGASSLGLSKKKSSPSSVLAGVGEAGLALVIAGVIFAAIIYILMSLEARRSAALHSRPSRELPGAHIPTKNAALQQRLDALVEEATKIAQEQGILTEVDAAENARLRAQHREEDWGWVLDDTRSRDKKINEEVVKRAKTGSCGNRSTDSSDRNEECGPHGVCISNHCSCAVAFSGTFCGPSVLLSHPYTPEEVPLARIGYEGNLILLQNSELQQNEDLQPFAVKETELTMVRHLLPSSDDVFKGEIFESCAVVGESGSLLLSNYGAAIDSHSFILQIGLPSFTDKDYKQFIGTKSRVHIIPTLSGNFNLETAAMVLAPPSSHNLEHLGSNFDAKQTQTRIIHPRFLQHLNVAFGSPSSSVGVLEAVMLALNICRSVTVFGIAPLPGVPSTYYQLCGSTSEEESVQKQQQLHSWLLLKKYHQAGLIEFGEHCAVDCEDATSKDKCNMCREQHNLDSSALIAAMRACP